MNVLKKFIFNRVTKWGDAGTGSQLWWPPKPAGIPVTHDNALTYSAIWRAISLISQDLAGLPWPVNQRDNKRQTETLWNHPATRLLNSMPNEETNAFVFRETLAAHALTWGNGYAEIEHDAANRPVAMWQIEPNRVRPDRDLSGKLIYEITNGTQANTVLTPDKMFHLKGLGYDGVVGYSVIAYAAKTIGLGLATEQFGSNFFANGANAGLMLQHPGALSDTALSHLKESLVESTNGINSNAPMILEEGMTAEKISIPPDDAQFLETRKFGVAEVARWYGVPLHKLQELDKSSFNNIEQQNIDYGTGTLMPWVRRCEMEANHKLISSAARGRIYTKMNMNALLRGDTASRGEWYGKMTTIGAMSINEVRALEDSNGIGADGDKYMVQMNLTTVDKVGEDPPAPQPAPVADPEEPEEEAPAARAIFNEIAQRITSRCSHRGKEALDNNKNDLPGLNKFIDKFIPDQSKYMRSQQTGPVEAFELSLDLEAFISAQVFEQYESILASFDLDQELFNIDHSLFTDQLFEACNG